MSPAPQLDAEALWAELLSEEPARIRKAWLELDDDEADAVLARTTRWVSGRPGTSIDQRRRDAASWHGARCRGAEHHE